MQLDIILRTHDQKSIHIRDNVYEKKDITQTCVNSLHKAVDVINKFDSNVPTISITTIDDHSSDETLGMLRNVVNLEDTGNNASLEKAFEIAADSTADIVYMVEDDYLHRLDSIFEMLVTYDNFTAKLGTKDLCLNLVDCPANYHSLNYGSGGTGRDGSLARIVGGVNYPWRTTEHTGGTFCTTPNVINTYWGAFDNLIKNWPKVDENDTWNKIWEEHVVLFTPLVPLAYHLSEKHPYYPYDELWKENKIISKLQDAA